MGNQNALRGIRLSRTHKTNPRKNFCSKSLSTMGAKLVVLKSAPNSSKVGPFCAQDGTEVFLK